MKKKITISIVLFFILLIVATFIFFPFDSIVKEQIEKSIGQDITIKNLKIKWNNINVQDVILKTPYETEFLKIKELKVKLYFLALLRKQIEIKDIQIDSPHLILRKNKKGEWQLPVFKGEDTPKNSLQFNIKEIKISDGSIIIQDEIKGFNIKLKNVGVIMKNNISLFKEGKTLINASAKCSEGGNLELKLRGNYKDQQFKGTLTVRDLNIKVLKTYIKGNVTVKKGIISLDSDFLIDKGYVKAPSILKAKGLEIESKGFLMGVSAPLLIELLKKQEEIIIPFNIWGRWNNLQNDLETEIKRKVSEEVGKTITSPIRTITKPLTDVIKKIQ